CGNDDGKFAVVSDNTDSFVLLFKRRRGAGFRGLVLPLNFCGFLFLDSRLCGNDDGKFAVVSDNTEAFRLHSYSGLTKTSTALPRLSSKRTIL
ncbi:TPA: hypothetical protein ACLAVG_001604, partial [Neisseria meningitidis]|uniref:hypothetical protein n=1 Tax=Neisseria meningitidis TaxID=487 RepID=UPI00197D6294